jgi:hypothetical protein
MTSPSGAALDSRRSLDPGRGLAAAGAGRAPVDVILDDSARGSSS